MQVNQTIHLPLLSPQLAHAAHSESLAVDSIIIIITITIITLHHSINLPPQLQPQPPRWVPAATGAAPARPPTPPTLHCAR